MNTVMNRLSLRILFIALSLLVCPVSQAQNTGKKKKATTEQQLDELFAKALADYNVPGLAIAIVKDGEVVLSKGYGVKDVNHEDKVDDKTLFAIASNSKAFTSAALAILVDEGKIKWSDKVRTYLPYFELYNPYVSAEMTVKDLLTHRSGLETFSGDLIWYGTTHSREEVIRRAKYLQPAYGFREAYGYSNIMYLAAGEVVQAVTGQSWDEFIKTRFFQPLGMTTSNTSITAFQPNGNIASPHNELKGKNMEIDYVNWDNINAAGSINSCVAELSQWIKLQLNKGTLDGKSYWTENRTYEMWENVTTKPVSKWQRQNMPSRHFNGYGLGWELMEYAGKKVISHGGGYDGMISKTVLVPEINLGFVILTNNISSLSSSLSFDILDTYLGVRTEPNWTSQFLKMKKEGEAQELQAANADEEARVKNTKPSLTLEKYTGTYHSKMYGDVVVSIQGNQLKIDFKPTALFKGDLVHWHYDTFQLNWTTQMMLPNGKVTFIIDANGNVSELKVVVDNPDFDFTELILHKQKD
jgi:CubicO group peptidase (beta-lactamase class C family)